MQGDPQVIDALNEILTAELTAINQYFVHYKMLENWGYHRIAKKKREESIEEMKHADRLIGRILFLDGVPNMQRLFPVRVGEDPIEMHKLDLDVEREAVGAAQQGHRADAREERRRHARVPREAPRQRGGLDRLARGPAQDRRGHRQGAVPRRAASRMTAGGVAGCAP